MSRTKQLLYKEPRDIEGTPYEVAEAAAKQAAALMDFAALAVEDTFVMARVAEMERQMATDLEPDGDFGATLVGQKLIGLKTDIENKAKTLRAVAVAAAYDPKAKVPA